MKNSLLSDITDNVSLRILDSIIQKDKPLVIQELSNEYSMSQYRYTLKRLRSLLVILIVKRKNKHYHYINPFYERMVIDLLAFRNELATSNGEFSPLMVILNTFNGWALTGLTALLHFVPALNLTMDRLSIAVRSNKEKKAINRCIPGDLIDIRVAPSFFIKRGIITVKGIPSVSPELVLFQSLKDENSRVRLASIFLLPYINPRQLMSRMLKMKTFPLTLIYLLVSLEEYLRETPDDSPLRRWFYNLDQYTPLTDFHYYMRPLLKKSANRPPLGKFTLLRKKWREETNETTKWSLIADAFQQEWVLFHPGELEKLFQVRGKTG